MSRAGPMVRLSMDALTGCNIFSIRVCFVSVLVPPSQISHAGENKINPQKPLPFSELFR